MDWKAIAKKHGYDTKRPICKFDISKLLYQIKNELNNYFNLLPVEIINYMINEYLYIHFEMQSFNIDVSIYYYTSEHSIEYYIYIIDEKDYYIISVKNIDECEFDILFSTENIKGLIQFYSDNYSEYNNGIFVIIENKKRKVYPIQEIYLQPLFKI